VPLSLSQTLIVLSWLPETINLLSYDIVTLTTQPL
jgi:hypothetical protein